ncbi:hypothetical protein C5749_18720 [Sphingobacterium gobiense]|uniref:Uncharacterized protein n=1 Tax=Sphingobacterium gobiense TaxID=1382456 RepID=A0A2S9JEW0_9SPHI|nr:hypothetical protein C5749_18720 [Sphingobacterium gobiense]
MYVAGFFVFLNKIYLLGRLYENVFIFVLFVSIGVGNDSIKKSKDTEKGNSNVSLLRSISKLQVQLALALVSIHY